MAEFENIQDLLNDFRSNVIREAKRNLTSQNTSGRLSKSLKSYVKESKNSIQISCQAALYLLIAYRVISIIFLVQS